MPKSLGKVERPRLAIAAASNWMVVVVNLIVTLTLTPFIVNKLGKAGFGTWSLVWSLVGYYGLLRMGVGTGIMRYLPFYKGRGDDRAVSEIVSSGLSLFSGVGLTILLFSFVFSKPIADFYKADAIFASLVCLTGLSAALQCPRMIFDASLRAEEKWVAVNGVGVLTSLIHGIGLGAVLFFGYGLIEMSYVIIAEEVVAFFLVTLILLMSCKEIRIRPSFAKLGRTCELLSFGFFTTMVTFGQYLPLQTHRLIIGKMVSFEAVGVYAIAAALIERARSLVWAPLQVSWPRFALLDGEGSRQELILLFYSVSRYTTFLSSAILLLFLVAGPPFITLWVGPGFELAQRVLIILSVSCLVETSLFANGSLLGSTGHQRIQALFALVEGIAGLLLSILFCWNMGLIGLAIGYSISVVTIRGFIIPWYVCRLFNIDFYNYYIECHLRPWLIIGILAIVCHGCGFVAFASTWFKLILFASFAGTIYLAMIWILALNQHDKNNLIAFIIMGIQRIRVNFIKMKANFTVS